MSHQMMHDRSPESLGPVAWKQIHEACEILDSNCECREECVSLSRGMHDLVNYKLKKPIMYPENLRKVAKRYQVAVDGCPGGNCP